MHTIPTRAEEKSMMESPDRWPRWPVLPVKNPRNREAGSSFPKCGCLVEHPEGEVKPIVYLFNVFSDKPYVDLKSSDKVVYETMDELLDAGWVVD